MSLFDTPKRIAVALGTLLVIALTWGAGNAFAQDETTLSVETERAQSGEAVDVPVQVTDFNGIGSISLTINYDSEVVSFPGGDVSTGDLISGEPRGSFQASRPEPGELRISFFDQTGTDPINLGDGTLFNITFSSFAGGSGEVTIDEENSEIGNAQAETVPVTFRNGAVVDQDAGTVSVGTVEGAALNETVSVPLSGENLQDVGSASLEIGFDASALQFEGVANDQSGLDLQGNANDGTVRIAGQSVEGGSLGDSFIEVEFSFLGGSPALDFLVSSEVTDPQGNVLPAEFADGGVAGDVPVVSFPDRGVGAGETISVPVQAEDLREVGAVTLETTYDPSVLTFEGSEEGFGALSVSNPSDGIVRISGQSSSGIDPSSNGDKFINLRFSVGQDLSLGTESVLGFNAEESELASIDAEPYNTAFESGLVRVEDTEIAVSADSVSYDVTAIDSTSGRVVTVTNESDSVATLEGEISGPEAPFSIASGGGPFTLEPGESQDVTVNYSPVEVSNPDRDTLSISHNADNEESPFEVPLAGQAEAPSIAASVEPDTATVRSGQELALTQSVANEATDAAVLEVEVTGVPDFLTLEGASVTSGEGTVDGQALTLQPGAEAELEYSFQESVDTTTVFGGAIVHQTNDPDAASPLELPVEITAEAVQVALNAQSLDLTAGDTELRVEDVIANQGDTVVITTDDGDGDFSDEEIAGSTPVEEDLDGEDVLVDVEGASPVDHAAHVSTDGTVPGVVATSDRAPVYATAQFDFSDETSVGPAETVTVDSVRVLYNGSVGRDTISINLHEASGGEITGDFIGISQEDLAVNVVHEEVAIDVIEPISPPAESPQRTESTIAETGEFFAMAHLGPAGTGADGGRVPVGGSQQPPLRTTASPGVIGDFATVEVEPADLSVDVSRSFEGTSDPANYQLVALPGSVDVDVAETFNVDRNRGINWRAFLELGGSGNGGNANVQSYGDEAFNFRPARAVWVLAQDGWSFEGTVPAIDAADGTPSFALQEGWNAISNPLRENLSWPAVREASGFADEDLPLFQWTTDSGFQSVDTLRSATSGEGYYVLNEAGVDSLDLTGGPASGTSLAAATDGEAKTDTLSRTVELAATTSETDMSSTVTVGMNRDAEETSAYQAPPSHFGGVALRIEKGSPAKKFMRMVTATDKETSRFDLSLQAEPGASVEISAGDLPRDVSGFGVALIDGNDTHDLQNGPATITVDEENGSATFQVRVGDAEKIAQQTAPDETKLKANYPNPFSIQTTIEYDVAEQSDVTIQVYNVLGQQVATLAKGTKQAGTHRVNWEGRSLSSGKYFVRLEAGGTVDTKQITVVR